MGLLSRMTNLLRRSRMDREIGEELRAHLDMRTDENVARGMTPEVARREAQVRFGNPAAMRERVAAADAEPGCREPAARCALCAAAAAPLAGICADGDSHAGAGHRRECDCVRDCECAAAAAAECGGAGPAV